MARKARKWTFRLTRAGWALAPVCLLLTLGAINSGLNVTYLLACLAFAILFAGILAPLWTGRGVDCRREIAEPPCAGESFEYTLVITSRRRSAARLVGVRDPLGGPKSDRKFLLHIPPKSTIRIPCLGAPMPRGAHPMPPLEWRSGFPFGLAECGARRAMEGELLVYPARGALLRETVSPARPRAGRSGAVSLTGALAEDFRSLREYRPGDSVRRIHWRATAHRGALHVRELERERFAPALILLDSRIPASITGEARAEAERSLELAVSFAAETARAAIRRGEGVAIAGFFPQPGLLIERERGAFHLETGDPFTTKDTKDTKDAKDTKETQAETTKNTPAVLRDLRVLRGGRSSGRGLDAVLEALARLTPSDAADAAALLPLAARAGMTAAGRIVGVSPVPETARTLRDALAGRPSQIYVASEPGFADVFRLWTMEVKG